MLNESIGKPKELWKALKALVLANKILLMQKKYIKNLRNSSTWY